MKDLQRELSTATWRKSSYSGSGDQCVQAAALSGSRYALQDTKDPQGPVLVFTEREWNAFLTAVRED